MIWMFNYEEIPRKWKINCNTKPLSLQFLTKTYQHPTSNRNETFTNWQGCKTSLTKDKNTCFHFRINFSKFYPQNIVPWRNGSSLKGRVHLSSYSTKEDLLILRNRKCNQDLEFSNLINLPLTFEICLKAVRQQVIYDPKSPLPPSWTVDRQLDEQWLSCEFFESLSTALSLLPHFRARQAKDRSLLRGVTNNKAAKHCWLFRETLQQ